MQHHHKLQNKYQNNHWIWKSADIADCRFLVCMYEAQAQAWCNYQLFWLMMLRAHTDIITDKADNNQWDAASGLTLLYCPHYEELQQEILDNILDSFGNSSLSEF